MQVGSFVVDTLFLGRLFRRSFALFLASSQSNDRVEGTRPHFEWASRDIYEWTGHAFKEAEEVPRRYYPLMHTTFTTIKERRNNIHSHKRKESTGELGV